ncbi:MAG: hypothetical protein Ta2E_08130 [Mycoplasmoidaceae bacterium]|nr:MAG: hypothetical protein Ta2E_08130 [Mycoplasmoidaceae bacterium]
MAIYHLIDLAYDVSKKEYQDKTFNFDQLYKDLLSKSKDCPVQTIGEFYCELLQDPRFSYIGDKKWRLREYLSEDQITNINENLYDIQIEDGTKASQSKQPSDDIAEEFEEEIDPDGESAVNDSSEL